MTDKTFQTRHQMLLTSALGVFSVYALLAEAALADPVKGKAVKLWINEQQQLAQALRSGSISGLGWHDAVNKLAKQVDVEQLVTAIGYSQLETIGQPLPPDHNPVKRFVQFLDDDGTPLRLSYGIATFTFDSHSVITPHAHKNMASAHMVIEGRVRIRTFDRIADQDGALLIRPTRDTVSEVGNAAAMTTVKDNVHWFTPVTPRAMTLDVIIDGLDPKLPEYVIQTIDPLGGHHGDDGTIVAPLISFEESSRLYTSRI